MVTPSIIHTTLIQIYLRKEKVSEYALGIILVLNPYETNMGWTKIVCLMGKHSSTFLSYNEANPINL